VLGPMDISGRKGGSGTFLEAGVESTPSLDSSQAAPVPLEAQPGGRSSDQTPVELP
jgi:hypothetical protein